MKKLSTSFAIILMVAALGLARPAFANMEHYEDHINAMKQASDELKSSNPELSEKLKKYADETEKWKGEHNEGALEQKRADVATLKQASEELKNTNKDLGDKVGDIADRWQKKLDKKEKEMTKD